MGDHFSGPRSFSDPAGDITDLFAFPSPGRAGRFTLILDTFPGAAATALFSDVITYRFRIRPLTIDGSDAGPGYIVGEDEQVIDFTFGAPSEDSGEVSADNGLIQLGTFTAPGGEKVSIEAQGTNSLEGANVLSIVLEFDTSTVFPADFGPLLAVVGETLTSGGHPMRLEHAGRSEFKNFVLGDSRYDTVNRDIEIRDLFNAEDAFRLEPYYLEAYRARVNANLARHDSLDGKTAWPLSDRGEHPLTEFLLADFLVVDAAKPFTEHSYLEIDRALIAGRPHTTCGGRPPNDDIVDAFLTLMISGVDGAAVSDGVDHAMKPATSTFPYLVAPNQDPPQVRPPSAPPQEH
jgi:hypothetical protein